MFATFHEANVLENMAIPSPILIYFNFDFDSGYESNLYKLSACMILYSKLES